jgi:hypothetical protein
LQKRVAAKAAKLSFESVASDIETETGVRLGTRQIKEIVDAAAQDFDAFYAQPCSQEIAQYAAAKPIQVLTFDGKGVVMRKEALREATRKRAEANVPKAPRGFARQDKSNRKRMATVAGIYQCQSSDVTSTVRCAVHKAWHSSSLRCDWCPNPAK